MAASEGVSPFPLPPTQYSKLYTDENVEQGKAPCPPPPIEGNYSMFGATFETDESIIRPLDVQGICRLYNQTRRTDRIAELKKLNHSILVNFLELLDILIKTPASDKRDSKLEDLRLLFINMHHLINELRPHQARETLRVMMERQKRQRLDTADKLQKHIGRVVAMLQGTSASLLMALSQEEDIKEQKSNSSGNTDLGEDKDDLQWRDDLLNAAVEDVS